MNCIFICVFNKRQYVDMYFLLVESIMLYGKLDENTKLLVYTSSNFMDMIKNNKWFDQNKISFAINDNYNTIDLACKARLDLFELPSISMYNKILYLDTDIIITNDIRPIFEIIKEEVLYTLNESTIDCIHHGSKLFGSEINLYDDKTAFTSGILLFNNCDKIKKLFTDIKNDIIKRPFKFECCDQPYIIYNAFKYNLYDNKILQNYVENISFIGIKSDIVYDYNKIIHHFPNGPGNWKPKLKIMEEFLRDLNFTEKENIINTNTNNTVIDIYDDIWTVSTQMRNDICDFFINKPKYKLAEIGAYKGYSTKELAKIFSEVYAVDNNNKFIKINKELNKNANNINYVNLDIYKHSWDILPTDIEVVFIDAGHSYESCKSDIMNSLNRFVNLKYIIFDDYGVWPGVKQIVDELLACNLLIFEKFIGITDVPGPNGIVNNTNEGIICSVNVSATINTIINKSYTWENSKITFLPNYKMSAFGKGNYVIRGLFDITATFGGRIHDITFNSDYTQFKSMRRGDSQIVSGQLV